MQAWLGEGPASAAGATWESVALSRTPSVFVLEMAMAISVVVAVWNAVLRSGAGSSVVLWQQQVGVRVSLRTKDALPSPCC